MPGAKGPAYFEDHFIPEIIDPRTLETLDAGEEGELVFTTVTKEHYHFTYRTRDLTTLIIVPVLVDAPCANEKMYRTKR